MKLTDLDPWWVGHGGEGITRDGAPVPRRERVGISFKCPCGCSPRIYLNIANPEDGGPSLGEPAWTRTGTEFADLTLAPSILRVGWCGWHGFVRAGEIVTA